jgi:type II secretory pathway predicted ATPase ExeA
MNTKLQTLYGLKFPPFRPGLPIEAICPTPPIDSFVHRVEQDLPLGGFALVTGDPGTGKSITLRILQHHLQNRHDVVVGTLEHPNSGPGDFYRELGDLFGVSLTPHNRWAGFKALRTRWAEHIDKTLLRPVLLIDEAQEAVTPVLNELRVLASKELDSRQLLSVVFAADARFTDRLRTPELMPLASRIHRRLLLEYASREQLCACLDHLLLVAGNPSLMTTELKTTLAEHAVGNYRVMMNMADEMLSVALLRELPRLDEKLYFETFQQPPPKRAAPAPRKR